MFAQMYVDCWVAASPHITVRGRDQELPLARVVEDEVALAKITDGWLLGQVSWVVRLLIP